MLLKIYRLLFISMVQKKIIRDDHIYLHQVVAEGNIHEFFFEIG